MPYARFSVFIKPDIRKCQNLQEELSGQRREAKRLRKIILKNNNSYLIKQQTVQGALWLATQTPSIYWYSLPSNSQGINAQKHCNRCSNIWYKNYLFELCYFIVFLYLKQLCTSVSVAVDIHLTVSQLGKYPPLATFTAVKSCLPLTVVFLLVHYLAVSINWKHPTQKRRCLWPVISALHISVFRVRKILLHRWGDNKRLKKNVMVIKRLPYLWQSSLRLLSFLGSFSLSDHQGPDKR